MNRHCVRMKLITWRNTNQKRIDTACGTRYPLFAGITATASTENDLFGLSGNRINKQLYVKQSDRLFIVYQLTEGAQASIYLKPD